MRKLSIITSILYITFSAVPLFAQVKTGITAGYQYDVGNMNDRRGIEGDVQQNAAPGVLFKLDMSAFFIRTGAEFSYPFEKGRVSSSVYNIEQTVVYFIEVPVYAGLRFPIRDFGEIYIGGGGSYIFSMGRVKTSSGRETLSEQLFGFGIIAGLEYSLFVDVTLLFEWEYLSCTGSPAASSGATYDDYTVDYSGSRFRMGLTYRFGEL